MPCRPTKSGKCCHTQCVIPDDSWSKISPFSAGLREIDTYLTFCFTIYYQIVKSIIHEWESSVYDPLTIWHVLCKYFI